MLPDLSPDLSPRPLRTAPFKSCIFDPLQDQLLFHGICKTGGTEPRTMKQTASFKGYDCSSRTPGSRREKSLTPQGVRLQAAEPPEGLRREPETATRVQAQPSRFVHYPSALLTEQSAFVQLALLELRRLTQVAAPRPKIPCQRMWREQAGTSSSPTRPPPEATRESNEIPFTAN